jgi:nucleoside-diphosphate-sugar epimerase
VFYLFAVAEFSDRSSFSWVRGGHLLTTSHFSTIYTLELFDIGLPLPSSLSAPQLAQLHGHPAIGSQRPFPNHSVMRKMGYAQSKLVTEHIIDRAAHQTGMTARVLRVGQIISDTVHGIWNATEAIPMILQTAETIHALPQLEDIVS